MVIISSPHRAEKFRYTSFCSSEAGERIQISSLELRYIYPRILIIPPKKRLNCTPPTMPMEEIAGKRKKESLITDEEEEEKKINNKKVHCMPVTAILLRNK